MFTWIKRVFLGIAVLGLLAAAPVQAQNGPPDRMKVFIGFDRQPGPAEETLVRAAGGSIRYTYSIVPAIAASVPENAIAGLLANPRVTRVEPVRAIHAVDHSADTGVPELEAVWGVEHIGSWAAHGVATGSGVAVAVIDSGIDCTHSDLSSNCVGGHDFVNDIEWNVTVPSDDNGHGTHVAGSIAAVYGGGNVVGVAPSADLVPLKVLNASGSGSFEDVVAALQWILAYNQSILDGEISANPIRVTNNSYGAGGNPGSTVEQAFDNAYSAGVLHIAAAGNSGKRGRFNTMIYPARFSSVVAVAATDEADDRASFSSVGNQMELAAPGVSISSTLSGGGYGTKSGTSMASPHAAGVAALVFSAYANLTAVAVRDVLKNTADDIGSGGWDRETGYGLVDADGAVGGTSVPTNDPPVASFTFGCPDLACDFNGSGSSDSDGSIASYDWVFDDGSTGSGVTVSHTYSVGDTTYTVRLTVKDDDGASDFDEQGVFVSEPGSGGGGITLTATGYKVKGRQKADLEWSGAAPNTDFDVFRDNTDVGDAVTNDAGVGSHTDNIGNRGGGSYTYQVCEQGTATCSDPVTVTF